MFLAVVITFFSILLIIYVTVLLFSREFVGKPEKYKSSRSAPEEFLIKKENHTGVQSGPECSGFSSAYVLRHYGIQADGLKVYEALPKALKDGAVVPKGIVQFFTKEGFTIHYYTGSLKNLEEEISKGNPVIVLIRTSIDTNWLHYVPVVGYDKEYFYLADSFSEKINTNARYYNRIVSRDEFIKLWKTKRIYIPFLNHIFLVVEKND